MGDTPFDRDLRNWVPPPRPGDVSLQGRFCRLESLDPARHGAQLHAANRADDAIWDYLPYGPFTTAEAYRGWADQAALEHDPKFFAIRVLKTDRACGVASFLRIKPEAGSIEVGHINFAPVLQRSAAATEAIYLMMKWAFESGYRRFEWKCDARNLGSRRAAQRFGFSCEGLFRQATIVKGRNRDTAWFACIDAEWPRLRDAYESWLAPENFDAQGRQIVSLATLTAPIRVSGDPALD
ncbi:MAG: GNAT family N-acetyltransferase [Paracoccaceae bacterium]